MGLAICARLADLGWSIVAHDRRRECRNLVIQSGAEWVESAAEAATRCSVLITVLPGTAEVNEVRDRVITALSPGATWIDATTAAPAIAQEIADAARTRGLRTLEAPVGGDPMAARQGQLVGFVGASQADLEANQELLGQLAKTIIHAGPPGSGYTIKLLVNLLWFGQAVASAEALSLAVRAGLDPEVVRGAVQLSAAASRFMERDAVALMSGDDLTAYSLERCHEQLRTILTVGDDLDVPLAVGERVTELYAQALERYGSVDGELLAARLIAERARVNFSA
jgi:3-hydroxyisobutyrate dehydrogenase